MVAVPYPGSREYRPRLYPIAAPVLSIRAKKRLERRRRVSAFVAYWVQDIASNWVDNRGACANIFDGIGRPLVGREPDSPRYRGPSRPICMRNYGPTLDRRTLLTTTGVGALAGLAGCLSFGDDEKPTTSATASPDDETDSDAPLTDHEYTQPAPVIDVPEQGYESTMRTVPARHELVAAEATGGPIELPEVWAWQADDHARRPAPTTSPTTPPSATRRCIPSTGGPRRRPITSNRGHP